MKLHRFAPLWTAALVFVAYALWAPSAALPRSRLLSALASWLPIGDVALRGRLAMGAVAALAAWGVAHVVAATSTPVATIAGVVAALLLVGAAPAWSAGAAGAVAVGCALLALTSWRRVAAAGPAEVPAREALGAAAALTVAAWLEPGYGALALPAAGLWWWRVGARRAGLRGLRGPRAAVLWGAPVLLGAAAALLARAVAAPGRALAAVAADGQLPVASARAAAQSLAELLGPTAVVAALAGALALGVSGRGAGASGDARSEDRWLAAGLLALAVGGLLLDGHRHRLGVPALLAAALLAGFAIQRLGALVAAAPSGVLGEAEPLASAPPNAAAVLAAGAGFVAFTAGFLVLAPSLL